MKLTQIMNKNEDVSKYTNAGISKFAVAIASLTATRPEAVQKFVDSNELNIEKLHQFVKKGKLSDRMDFVSAIAGKPNNPIQKKMIKMFKESVNEADVNWNAVQNAIINFLKMNTKILDKRVQEKDLDGVKGGLKSIISGLTNAQRSLKLESVNEASRRATDFYGDSKHGKAIDLLLKGKWDSKKVENFLEKLGGGNDVKYARIIDFVSGDAGLNIRKYKNIGEQLPELMKQLEVLYKDFLSESVNEEKYPNAVAEFNKELIKHPMVKKAAQFYKKSPAEIVKVLQQRLYSKGDKTGNTKEVYIDFKDTTSGITIKHKMKFNESVESVNESHFKVGDSVTCIKSGMSGQVIGLDKEHGGEDEKYYKVKREDGEVVKYSPNELKLNESLTEASYNFGKEEYTNKNMTPTQILDLAMAYAKVPGKGNPMYNNKMENMIKVANDLAKLNGTKQMDAKSRGKEPALILFLLKNGLVTQEEYVKLYKNLLEKQIAVVKALKNADPASRMIGGAAARQAHKDMRGEFEESVVNEDANMNKKVKMLLDKHLKDLRKGGANHQWAVMHILMGALSDANFHSEAKKVSAIFGSKAKYEGDPMAEKDLEKLYHYDLGSDVAKICQWDGGDIVDAIGFYVSMTIGRPVGEKIEKLVESLKEDFSAVVGKTIFSDGKGKLFFGYYKEDDSVHFVDYNTWKKLTMKDVSKSDMHKKQVLDTILRNQKQFNKKVEYNMWYKKTNPSFEQSMDYFMKNGFVGNINKGGIKVN